MQRELNLWQKWLVQELFKDFDLDIKYYEGKEYLVADALRCCNWITEAYLTLEELKNVIGIVNKSSYDYGIKIIGYID